MLMWYVSYKFSFMCSAFIVDNAEEARRYALEELENEFLDGGSWCYDKVTHERYWMPIADMIEDIWYAEYEED